MKAGNRICHVAFSVWMISLLPSAVAPPHGSTRSFSMRFHFMASPERMWAGGVQLHHKVSITAHSLCSPSGLSESTGLPQTDSLGILSESPQRPRRSEPGLNIQWRKDTSQPPSPHGVRVSVDMSFPAWPKMCRHTKPQSESVCVVQAPGSLQRVFFFFFLLNDSSTNPTPCRHPVFSLFSL